MDQSGAQLHYSPIVEAVVEIECDMPANFSLPDTQAEALRMYQERYPLLQIQMREQVAVQIGASSEESSVHERSRAVQAFQFRQKNGEQLVQVRTQGFSFNRLKPYTTLDDYMPEIELAWTQFVQVAKPLQVKVIRLRYINRILLPLDKGGLDFADYLRASPHLPDECDLTFLGFFHQHSALERTMRAEVNIVTTTQPEEAGQLPLILDIGVNLPGTGKVEDWSWIKQRISSLRDLKNRIFRNTLTEQCLNLFQQR